MLYDVRAARENIRNKDGKRVFYLGPGDQLTPSARDALQSMRVEICTPPQKGAPKPEHMTHLNAETLVPKTHPIIRFRGMVDDLEAEILLCGHQCPQLKGDLKELLTLARQLIAADVLGEELKETELLGLSQQQLRDHSHLPQKYYGKPHFMPTFDDSEAILRLNHLRTTIRKTELSAMDAHPNRNDMLQALNRMSSAVYIMMIKLTIDN